jgi:hypothetical protein
MIGLPAGTRIWIVAGMTDMRRGFVGLSGMVQAALKENPFSGQVYIFRGRRGDLIKVFVVRWRRALSFRETIGARPIYLATGNEWNGVADTSTAFDVARGDRLASTGAHVRAADGCVTAI